MSNKQNTKEHGVKRIPPSLPTRSQMVTAFNATHPDHYLSRDRSAEDNIGSEVLLTWRFTNAKGRSAVTTTYYQYTHCRSLASVVRLVNTYFNSSGNVRFAIALRSIRLLTWDASQDIISTLIDSAS